MSRDPLQDVATILAAAIQAHGWEKIEELLPEHISISIKNFYERKE